RVPVGAARRERERPARRDAEQASPRVEVVEHREEVLLVRAAAVEEDEQSLRVAARRPLQVLHRATVAFVPRLSESAGRGRRRNPMGRKGFVALLAIGAALMWASTAAAGDFD